MRREPMGAHARAMHEHMPTSNATDGRTDGLTESIGHQPEITLSSVTRGRAYGDVDSASEATS